MLQSDWLLMCNGGSLAGGPSHNHHPGFTILGLPSGQFSAPDFALTSPLLPPNDESVWFASYVLQGSQTSAGDPLSNPEKGYCAAV